MDRAISQKVEDLQAARLAIAERSRALAARELEARTLRLGIEAELRAGTTKTEAEKFAKADPRYLEHERTTMQIAYERDVLLATAENLRLVVLLGLEESRVDEPALVDA